MLKLYWTKNETVDKKTELLLARNMGGNFEIKRTPRGKPYIEGNPLYFSITHSKSFAAIAVSECPVGVDMELFGDRKFESVLSRFSERERVEINGNPLLFLKNWVSKEAYIKMTGGTLARDLKRLEYFEETLYLDGKKTHCGLKILPFSDKGLIAVCTAKPDILKDIVYESFDNSNE